jgi:hypothetical protein
MTTSSSHSYARGARTGAASKDEAALLEASAHLTERDRELVRLVGEHRVLTTGQLAAIGFANLTTARHRLSVLVRLRLLRRFRPHPSTGSAPWHYVLGPVGAALLGTEDRDDKKWAPQVSADRQLGLERSQRLGHMTGRNQFFVALVAHARQHGGELAEWLNETQAAAHALGDLLVAPGTWDRLPRPGGAGTWAADPPSAVLPAGVRDTGTEHLPVLSGKLDGYALLASVLANDAGQAAPPLLFCFAPHAASRPPAARWPTAGTQPRCGSPRRRSTRTSPARPDRSGCR